MSRRSTTQLGQALQDAGYPLGAVALILGVTRSTLHARITGRRGALGRDQLARIAALLRISEEECASLAQAEHRDLGVLIEVDQDVAAEHDVEGFAE